MATIYAYPDEVIPARRLYRPYGSALDLLYCKAPEVVLSGPAGTGKSRACLEKIHLCAEKYAGMRGLIVRKTRESLTESALVTFEEKVVPLGHPILSGPQRRMRQAYHYPNGSEIVIGGMDKPSKIMSTEFDLVYVQEAIELTEEDWEAITTRLRNGVIPYQQIIADTNPDTPTHWLKQRSGGGTTLMLESRHEDNPVLWDSERQEWTPAGQVYISKLDNLTGPRKPRLRHGKWVQAEGAIYEEWDRSVHLIDRFEIPSDWPRYWVVDFGFTNPFCWQAWAEDPDGRLYRYREIYHTKRLVQDHVTDILTATKDEPKPRAILCDHDAEDRETFEQHNILCLTCKKAIRSNDQGNHKGHDLIGFNLKTQPAKKEVSPGIQAVAVRLQPAGDGKHRLYLLRDSRLERDDSLAEAKKPTCTEEEVDAYVWDVSKNQKKGEEPLKKDDHGCDAIRYMVAHKDLRLSRSFGAS